MPESVAVHQATAAAVDLAVIVVFSALLTWTTGWSGAEVQMSAPTAR